MFLYTIFHSVAESAVLIFPTLYALTGGLILQKLLGYNFSVAVWVGYIALFGIAVETGVVMVVYLHEALNRRLASGRPLKHEDIEEAIIEGAVLRLRSKLVTVCVVLAGLIAILGESGDGADVMKPSRAHRRQHDHVDNSRADAGARIFRVDERARAAFVAAYSRENDRQTTKNFRGDLGPPGKVISVPSAAIATRLALESFDAFFSCGTPIRALVTKSIE